MGRHILVTKLGEVVRKKRFVRLFEKWRSSWLHADYIRQHTTCSLSKNPRRATHRSYWVDITPSPGQLWFKLELLDCELKRTNHRKIPDDRHVMLHSNETHNWDTASSWGCFGLYVTYIYRPYSEKHSVRCHARRTEGCRKHLRSRGGIVNVKCKTYIALESIEPSTELSCLSQTACMNTRSTQTSAL